jgi:hypothetical protein
VSIWTYRRWSNRHMPENEFQAQLPVITVSKPEYGLSQRTKIPHITCIYIVPIIRFFVKRKAVQFERNRGAQNAHKRAHPRREGCNCGIPQANRGESGQENPPSPGPQTAKPETPPPDRYQPGRKSRTETDRPQSGNAPSKS